MIRRSTISGLTAISRLTTISALATLLALLVTPVAALAVEIEIEVSNHLFTPEVVSVQPGDTVIWRNVQGIHNVRAPDGSFSSGTPSGPGWSFRQDFTTPRGEIIYQCDAHPGQKGALVVEISNPTFVIDYGITGAWFERATSGQGFSLLVLPERNQLVAYWFTFVPAGGKQQWMVGVGDINGNSVDIDMTIPTGGMFNMPVPVVTPVWGNAKFEFHSCTRATVSYAAADQSVSGSIELERLTPIIECPAGENR